MHGCNADLGTSVEGWEEGSEGEKVAGGQELVIGRSLWPTGGDGVLDNGGEES